MSADNASTARTIWKGDALTGSGHVSTSSPALTDTELTWPARVGEIPGTTPEELLGAAHAGCYAMALNFALGAAGFKPDELDVTATVAFAPIEGGFAVKSVKLASCVRARSTASASARFACSDPSHATKMLVNILHPSPSVSSCSLRAC